MEKVADAVANNRIRDLWKETHKIKGRNNVKPCSFNGHFNEEEIIQHVF